jgi:hypothetical protein
LAATEFVVLPIFGSTRQPEYQIEIRLGQAHILTIDELNKALTAARRQLTPGVA